MAESFPPRPNPWSQAQAAPPPPDDSALTALASNDPVRLAWERADADEATVSFGAGANDTRVLERLSGVVLGGGILTILTLAFYRFWMKTKQRRLVWRETRINGEGFEYDGSPYELFVGSMMAITILAVWLGVVNVVLSYYALAFWQSQELAAAIVFVTAAPLAAFATHRARRYRLMRTSWRGIRCGMDGSAFGYMTLWAVWTVVEIGTLWLAHPLKRVALERRLTRNMLFGDARFEFHGTGWALFPRWLLTWGCAVATAALTVALTAPVASIIGGFNISRETFATLEQAQAALPMWPPFVTAGVFMYLMPVYFARLQSYIMNARRIADVRFETKLSGWDVTGPQLAGLLRYILPGALFSAASAAALTAFLMIAQAIEGGGSDFNPLESQTFLESLAQLDSLMAKLVLAAGFWVSSGIIVLMSAWIALAPVFYRRHRNLCNATRVTGLHSLRRVRPRAREDAEGEGLADALDVGGL